MAVGARRRDIRRQFLLEATLLAGAGGATGVLIGTAASFLINQVFPARVELQSALLGMVLAILTGLAAGIAPAAAAAKLPPIEALRYE
jgi:ABC-type antimicrobial peptide transport system permease subunit